MSEIEVQTGSQGAREADASGENPPIVDREGMKWYVVHTYSGFEKKVKETLRQRVEANGMLDDFGDILIPTEDVVEMKGGKKVVTQKKYFPGYILVQMRMSDNAWHLVKNTPKVTGFIGSERSPVPVSREDVEGIIRQVSTSAEKPRTKVSFEKGEQLRITDGPFSNFTGVVEEVNAVRSTLKLVITIFGRATPVELDFLQVEKVS